MASQNCPKCNKQNTNSIECDFCGTDFTEYKRQKKESLDQVYKLISDGELAEARELAEKLCAEFPDSRSDFLLLLSNINRDLNITEKYQLAQELFNQGDYGQAVLLLRNIKAFAPRLEEKIITLRRKTERYGDHDQQFALAVERFNEGGFANAKILFSKINGYEQQDKVDDYLQKIGALREKLLDDAVCCLQKNLFDYAAIKFDELHTNFPDTRSETKGYLSILSQKKEIKDLLLAAAHQARKEGRFVEAKVIYSFLGWQCQELLPKLRPYIEEISSRAIISLADCEREEIIDFTSLGIQVNNNGFLEPAALETESAMMNNVGQCLTVITPVIINPDPLADTANKSVDIDGEEVADFV